MCFGRCYRITEDDTCDSWGGLTLTHEVDALLKIFSQLDMCDKITMKIKVCEFVFLDTTSLFSFRKCENKGSTKVCEISKCAPSMWEQVNAMHMMVDSLRTHNVLC